MGGEYSGLQTSLFLVLEKEDCQAPGKIYRLSVKLSAFFFAKRCDEKLIKSNGKYMSAIAVSINVFANKCSASMIYIERGVGRRDVSICIHIYIHRSI